MGVRSGPRIPSESREEGGVLLIHSDTTDGSTSFVDSGPSKRAITTGGAVHHDSANAISKFGATSIYFDGSGDFLKIASSSDWAFTGDFTVDLWVNPQDTGSGNLVGDYYIGSVSTSPDWQFIYNGSNQRVNMWRGSVLATSSTDSVPRNQWTHVALVRSGSGTNNCKIYINGILDGQDTFTTTVGRGLNLWVGIDGNESAEPYLGYMDEIRISNTARWTENFKPPHRPYATRDLVLHLDAANAHSYAGEPTRSYGAYYYEPKLDLDGDGTPDTAVGGKFREGVDSYASSDMGHAEASVRHPNAKLINIMSGAPTEVL